MTRAVPLWVGKTDDDPVPPRVRLRIFEREDGRCWLSGRKIRPGEPWDLDHKIALCNGGRHSEDNLAPALKDKHREKSRDDLAIKSKTAKVAGKHRGTFNKAKRQMPGSKASGWRKRMDGTVERRR